MFNPLIELIKGTDNHLDLDTAKLLLANANPKSHIAYITKEGVEYIGGKKE